MPTFKVWEHGEAEEYEAYEVLASDAERAAEDFVEKRWQDDARGDPNDVYDHICVRDPSGEAHHFRVRGAVTIDFYADLIEADD